MKVAGRRQLFSRWLWRQRGLRYVYLLLVLVSFLEAFKLHDNMVRGEAEAQAPKNRLARPQERVYIAALHWMTGDVVRDSWADGVVRLTETFGADNVFVSVYESGSWDDTKDGLRVLEAELEGRGVPHRIELSDETHQDELDRALAEGDYIEGPDGEKRVRRIPYMARIRNHVLDDLLALSDSGVHFDKVLFLGDVVFSTQDVLNLLDTNGGHYAAACSLDFKDAPSYYDTFALRDLQGRDAITSTWPFFRPGASRQAVMAGGDAVPVRSCWNGIVAMRADPFVSAFTRLRFRAAPDSLARHHVEGSECCLIHADNPLSTSLGVFLNPRVRVAYDRPTYEALHPEGDAAWLSTWGLFWGTWINRVLGWASPLQGYVAQKWVKATVNKWEAQDTLNYEPGGFCLVDEMQVLVFNGWQHV